MRVPTQPALLAALLVLPAWGALGNPGPAQEDPATAPTVDAPWLELPDDPLGRLWASVGPGTEPWTRMREPGLVPPDAAGEPWAAWASALGALEEDAQTSDGARREAKLLLAHLAAEDRRGEDAFGWVLEFGAGDAEAIAGSLPYLFPGVPRTTELGPGGRPVALEPGVTLRPYVPPPSAEEAAQDILWRESIARGLVVGRTTFDLKLKLDGSGVVAEFENVDGPPVKVVVVLPVPPGYRLKSLYRDWELVPAPEGIDEATYDWAGVPVEVIVRKGELETSVFGRIARTETRMPRVPLGELPAFVREAGLEFLVPDAVEGEPSEPWGDIARAFGDVAGIGIRVTRAGAAPGAPASQPHRVDFTRAADPVRLRRVLTSALEARAR